MGIGVDVVGRVVVGWSMRCIRGIRDRGLTVCLPLVKYTRSLRGTVHLNRGAPSGLVGTLSIRRLRCGFGFVRTIQGLLAHMKLSTVTSLVKR